MADKLDPFSYTHKGHFMTTLNVARVYLRVSTEDQDLQRQEAIIRKARTSGCKSGQPALSQKRRRVGAVRAECLHIDRGIGPAAAPAAEIAATATALMVASASALAGMAHNGMDNIPKEGTWLLDGGERVFNQNRDLTKYLTYNSIISVASRA